MLPLLVCHLLQQPVDKHRLSWQIEGNSCLNQSPPGGCSKLTLAGLTAGTEVYDAVLDSDLERLPHTSSQHLWGGAPPSSNVNADPFAFANPRDPRVGTPLMDFLSADRQHSRGVHVSGSVSPVVADKTPSMPHGSRARHTVRSSTKKPDPLAFLDHVTEGTNTDDNADH